MIAPSDLKQMRPEVEALANFALNVDYGRPILDLCDYIRDLEEQLEVVLRQRDEERRRAINAETRVIRLQRGKL